MQVYPFSCLGVDFKKVSMEGMAVSIQGFFVRVYDVPHHIPPLHIVTVQSNCEVKGLSILSERKMHHTLWHVEEVSRGHQKVVA